MNPIKCPYLGLKDDPNTALQFPSEGNFCHHAEPVAPVSRQHQQEFCLTENYTLCPVYQMAQKAPLPAAILAPYVRRNRIRQVIALVAVPLMVAGAAAAVNLLDLPALATRLAGGAPQDSAPYIFSVPVSGIFEDQSNLNPTYTPFLPFTPSPTQAARPLVANCQVPAGWQPYTLLPADSLIRLSAIYGVDVQTLQSANCLTVNTRLQPGEILYVPAKAVIPPTSTATNAPLVAEKAAGAEIGSPKEAAPTASPFVQAVEVTNTAVPHTNPPSPVPPTATPLAPPPPPPPATQTPPPLPTASPLPSQTPLPSPTASPLPSLTPQPSLTASLPPSQTPRPSSTPQPSPTASLPPSQTPRPSQTPKPSKTPKPSNTPRPSQTPNPTNTPPPLPTATAVPPTNTPLPPPRPR